MGTSMSAHDIAAESIFERRRNIPAPEAVSHATMFIWTIVFLDDESIFAARNPGTKMLSSERTFALFSQRRRFSQRGF
jgi:hypothetical protein